MEMIIREQKWAGGKKDEEEEEEEEEIEEKKIICALFSQFSRTINSPKSLLAFN